MAGRRNTNREQHAAQVDEQVAAPTRTPRQEPASEAVRRTRAGRSLDQFSAPARRVLAKAEDEARQRNHPEIRPEHLRLALLSEVHVPGAPELRRLGAADVSALRADLDARLQHGEQPVHGPLSLSDGCKRVLQLAAEEMERLGTPQVSTDHLQIGLVAEGSAVDPSTITALALRGLRMAMGNRPSGRFRPPDAVGMVQLGSPSGTRDNVVTLRIGDADLAAVNALVEVGIARTRSEGAAWLLHAGIAANHSLFERAQGIVDEIRRLREEAQQLAQEQAAESAEPSVPSREASEQTQRTVTSQA